MSKFVLAPDGQWIWGDEKTAVKLTETPGPSTDQFLQVRWALLDPAHDKAVTERVLRNIEEGVESLRTTLYSTTKELVKANGKAQQAQSCIKDWEANYSTLNKAYNSAYEYQAKAHHLQYWLTDCAPITWAERMASW